MAKKTKERTEKILPDDAPEETFRAIIEDMEKEGWIHASTSFHNVVLTFEREIPEPQEQKIADMAYDEPSPPSDALDPWEDDCKAKPEQGPDIQKSKDRELQKKKARSVLKVIDLDLPATDEVDICERIFHAKNEAEIDEIILRAVCR